MKISTKFKKYSTIAGSILMLFPTGVNYLQGNVLPYIVSYLHSLGKYQDTNIGSEVWIIGLYYAGFISTIMTSYFEKKFGMRFMMFVGVILISTGFLSTHFSVQYSMWLVAFTFGLLPGIGVAQCINVTISIIVKWMPDRMGFGVSVITTGSGIGVLVLNNAIMQYVNPEDIKTNKTINSINQYIIVDLLLRACWSFYNVLQPSSVFTDEGILARTPYLFLLLGSITVLVQIVSIFFIYIVPEADEEEQIILEKSDHWSPKETDRDKVVNFRTDVESYAASNLNLLQVLRQPSAYLLMVASSFYLGATLVVSATYKVQSFGEQFIKEDSILTNIGGVAGFMAPIFRPIFGILADKISHKLCLISMCAVLVVLLETFYYTQYMGVAGYSLWLVLLMVHLGGGQPLYRSTIPRCYGVENQSSNQTILSFGYCTVAIGISLTAPLILSKLGWFYLFPIIGILPLLSILALAVFNVRLKDGTRI
ncbi:hypothetical protein LOTGIDRAFT_169087 [Lottia gigantea]|uniref:Major facilitator superfamily (MFS) profile domain-containing protein n=1 Tax=Lottia gigantea TaxID=225164 RepID=V3YZJ0_LOTGI|nr:hypothetical protein LOTGIDRAFT_169087 [Lottia gigantea]ESO83618.1 hypothetical protein LOTGIDRAFT_169087 [Lottia gigantea]